MRFEARLTAYDMLDQVAVALVILEAADTPQISTRVVLRSTTVVRSTGESDPREWARDALVAALEAL